MSGRLGVMGVTVSGLPGSRMRSFQNPGSARGVLAPLLHSPFPQPPPQPQIPSGALHPMGTGRSSGFSLQPGDLSTPPAAAFKGPLLLRPPPLTTLKAMSWGFQATHLHPPSYSGAAGGSCLFFQKYLLPSRQLCRPPAPRDRHPLAWLPLAWLPGSSDSLHQQMPVPRDFRLCVGNLSPLPSFP